MILQEFLISQGVLMVDTTPTANVQLPHAPAHSMAALPGDVPWPPVVRTMSTEICPGDIPVVKP